MVGDIFTNCVCSTREGYVLTHVCPSVCPQGGTPHSQVGGTPARSSWGVSHLAGGRYPSQVRIYPARSDRGGTWARSNGGEVPEVGYPLARSGGGTQGGIHPWPGLMGVPKVGTQWQGYPQQGYSPSTGQQMEYLICRIWYASCIHAGGLSCSILCLIAN